MSFVYSITEDNKIPIQKKLSIASKIVISARVERKLLNFAPNSTPTMSTVPNSRNARVVCSSRHPRKYSLLGAGDNNSISSVPSLNSVINALPIFMSVATARTFNADPSTIWLEKSYISNLKSQLPALKESVFNIDTPHLLHTTNKLCNFEEEFETFYREYASYGELSETYACGASTCLLVKVINYALKYSNEFIEIESDQTNQIVRYLDQHFLKEIGVEDLARTFHMSKSSLNKFFQKQLNTTCHQYILKKRLALAVSLIRQDVPLKTVAVQSGFGDYSSFFRAFKKMYHISPTECQADNEKLKKIKH